LLAHNREENGDKNLWYIDNGASNHMCGYKEKFVELEEKEKENVSSDDSSKVQIQGKSTNFNFLIRWWSQINQGCLLCS